VTAAGPRESADGIRFEIRDGARRVSCAVSGEALDAVAGLSAPSTPALRRASFDRFRTLIHAAAVMRLVAGTESGEPILITGRDLKRVPSAPGLPKFGTSGRGAAGTVPVGFDPQHS